MKVNFVELFDDNLVQRIEEFPIPTIECPIAGLGFVHYVVGQIVSANAGQFAGAYLYSV